MESKRIVLNMRMTEKEKNLLLKWSSNVGLSMTEYIKEKIFGKKIVKRELDEK